MTPLSYWYDNQTRRIMGQLVRMFSAFQYCSGITSTGAKIFSTVPCTYSSSSRQAMNIVKNNSENTANSFPQMVVSIGSIKMAPEYRSTPSMVRTVSVVERQFDEATKLYNSSLGDGYTVESYMPVPYMLTIALDIFTTNLDQKFQLCEQIQTIFNPMLTLQTSMNPADWTGLTVVEMTDINYSSKSFPLGSDTDLVDAATFTFRVPYWINPPAKVKKQNIIREIITNIGDATSAQHGETFGSIFPEGSAWTQVFTTYGEYGINIQDGSNGTYNITIDGGDGTIRDWMDLFQYYGQYNSGASSLTIKPFSDLTEDSNRIISGTISINQTNPEILIWTLESSSLPPLTGPENIQNIIDPTKTYPGNGLTPVSGQSYLITENISNNISTLWGGLSATKDGIITYNGTNWSVSFNPLTTTSCQICDQQDGSYWTFVEGSWRNTVLGTYSAGYWNLVM